ncbi:MAG TPA: hypothetical protein EYO53_01295, partial [Alphaproteobacteria bacterium]|nr:hypothetical protein [Alphaproteobacteria bacterium]
MVVRYCSRSTLTNAWLPSLDADGELEQQLFLIRPKIILALGRIAAQWLLQSNEPVGRLRGHVRHFGSQKTPLVVSYHPAYLLRSPLKKAKAWEDLILVRQMLRMEE